jgi:Cu+-exporting ATPase
LKKAASLTIYSDHPISKAITGFAKEQKVSFEKSANFHSHTGEGVSGIFNGKAILLGSVSFLERQKIDFNSYHPFFESDPRVMVGIAEEGTCTGLIFLKDRVKEGSLEAVRQLQELGKNIYLISGDRKNVVEAIAKQLEVDGFFAQASPEDKINYVKKLQKEGKVVGMVGDGVNDAPALAASDVGFAVESGTDVAMENASIGLMHSSLLSLLTCVYLSKSAVAKIRQNLFFAFGYNALGIPLAAFGLLNPVIAALAMSLSSISVVLNSVLLKKRGFR